MSMVNLDQLVVDFQKKDVTAFEKLYELYFLNIYGVIKTFKINDEEAQEMCQDIFVKVWNSAEQYNESKGRFFTWLLNIARNAAIDKLRSKDFKNGKKNIPISKYKDLGIHSDNNSDYPYNLSVDKLLEHINPEMRNVLVMCYFRGYTQKEVAENLNIPLGTVKSRIRNSIQMIRAYQTGKNDPEN